MKNSILSIAIVIVVAASPAMAQNAHFITATGVIAASGDYTASWKEAGLGNCPPNGECTYTLTATVQSTWQCFNGGDNKPHGAPNAGGASPETTTGSFPPSHNGSITASLTLTPNSGSLSCQGGGLKLCLVAVNYESVVLTDITFGDAVDLPGGSVDIAPPSKTSAGTCQ